MEVTKSLDTFPLCGNEIPWYIKKQRESFNVVPFRGKRQIFHFFSITSYFMGVMQIVIFFLLGANNDELFSTS